MNPLGADIDGMAERLDPDVDLDAYAQDLDRGPSDVIRRIATFPYRPSPRSTARLSGQGRTWRSPAT